MVTRAALAFRPVLAFAYAFGAEGGNGQQPRRLTGSSAQQRQQNAHRGHALQSLNVWNALRRTGRTDDNQTVEQTTAGMSAEHRDVWLQQQLTQTVKDMEGKGQQLQKSKIGTSYFAPPDSPRRGAGIDHWSGKDHIEVNRDDMRHLTVKELRSVMAHQLAQTQPHLMNYSNQAGNSPDAALVYGAKTYQSALHKLQIATQNQDPVSPEGQRGVTNHLDPRATLAGQDQGANPATHEVRPQPQVQSRQSPLSR